MYSPKLYRVYKFDFKFLKDNSLNITSSKDDLSLFEINQQDNMLFRQVRIVTNDYSNFNKYIVFVDGRGYNSNIEIFKKMIIDGFCINNKKFVLGERSPSMTRNSILSFIDESIYSDIDERVSMGLDIKSTVLSKYIGYRGLMFSSCHCFDNWIPKVVVVKDCYKVIKNQNIKYVVDDVREYVDKKTGEDKKFIQKKIVQGIKDIKINVFDGCGIHHPNITKTVQSLLNSKTPPTSFMVRMPFFKGLSHEMNYTEFFLERGIDYITDIWGIKHNVRDEMMIVTESMYKGYKYFKKYNDIRDWEEYWSAFKKYNHCFAVAKWNFSHEEEPVYTRANYQILQDLDLSFDDFKELSNKSIEWVIKCLEDDIRYTYCFLGMTYDMHNPMNDYVKAILKDPEMMKEKSVRMYVVDMFKKYIDNFKCGKLYLKACFKMLSPDLIALMEHIGGLQPFGCLRENEFYSNNIDGDLNGEFLIERNPHICKSEHTILTAVNNKFTKKYISHLSNVCMVNCKSLTPQRLNGADYDGDLVLVIDEPIMLSGVDSNCPIVIDIEDKITVNPEEYNKENIYKMILRTMKSMIGETSNCATTYHNRVAKTVKQKKVYEEYVDLLSVINGKNIDFAKTGVLMNIPRYIAKYAKPLPYFMKYRSEYYRRQHNLAMTNSNMNRLAIKIEKWHKKNIRFKKTYKDFNYNIMIDKNTKIDYDMFCKIEKIYLEYCKEMKEISKSETAFRNPQKYGEYINQNYPDLTIEEINNFYFDFNYYYKKYKKKCLEVCDNKQELANITVKLCYEKYPNKNKKFIWKVASEGVLLNIKQKDIFLPQRDNDGEFEYLGKKYTMMKVFENKGDY